MRRLISFALLLALVSAVPSPQWNYGFDNPRILHDARHAALDGSFKYQYSTQDGIKHNVAATSDKLVSGAYSYTDGTGSFVKWNYNAGAVKAAKERKTSPNRYNDYDDGKYDPYYQDDYEYEYYEPAFGEDRQNLAFFQNQRNRNTYDEFDNFQFF